jgi:hypothetical protein
VLREWRFELLFLVAAGAHALVFGGAAAAVERGWIGSRTLLVALSSHRDAIEVDIEPAVLALPRVQVPPPPQPPSPDDALPREEPRVAANDVPRSATRSDRPTEPGNVEPPPNAAPPSSAPPRSEYDPLPPTGVLTAPGIGGPPVWSMPGVLPDSGRPAPAPTTAPRAREVDRDIAGKVIRQAMDQNDKAKGIDIPAVGTAASAVQASLYASDLPTESRGTIAIRIGANGSVTDVKVVSAVGGTADQWERAAQAAVASLKAQRLSLPDAYKKGMIVYVSAVSVEQLPAGKGSGISGNTATFDVSNIGAKKRQVVRVSTRKVAID